jgi:hypothetical protein
MPTTGVLRLTYRIHSVAQSPSVIGVAAEFYTIIGAPAAGQALVITSVHVNTLATGGQVGLLISSDGCASGTNFDYVTPGSTGNTVLPYSPGVLVPAGDSVCAFPDGGPYAITVSGYSVPSAAG